jgi:hypothetical protein
MPTTRQPSSDLATSKCVAQRWISVSSALRRDQITSIAAPTTLYTNTRRSGTTVWVYPASLSAAWLNSRKAATLASSRHQKDCSSPVTCIGVPQYWWMNSGPSEDVPLATATQRGR